eukprot:30409-Pelagococcus_subviridis.AAC.2
MIGVMDEYARCLRVVPSFKATNVGVELKGVRREVERHRGVSGLKARDPGRRETQGEKVLKDRRSHRRRGRMGTSVKRERASSLARSPRPSPPPRRRTRARRGPGTHTRTATRPGRIGRSRLASPTDEEAGARVEGGRVRARRRRRGGVERRQLELKAVEGGD